MSRLDQALALLFEGCGYVEVTNDRVLAAQIFRAARDASYGWEITGGSHRGDTPQEVIFFICAEPPLCDGDCGERTASPTGMCYRCQCEAHADGWYSMDDGHARVGRSDDEIHREIEFLSSL